MNTIMLSSEPDNLQVIIGGCVLLAVIGFFWMFGNKKKKNDSGEE